MSKNEGESSNWLTQLKWDNEGLIPAIAQDAESKTILMMAWMNATALQQTVATGHAVYWSRSRQKLWHKGEASGHQQDIKEIRIDCDNDVILLMVEQQGGIACHTGRAHCFFKKLAQHDQEHHEWTEVDPILKDPKAIYGK